MTKEEYIGKRYAAEVYMGGSEMEMENMKELRTNAGCPTGDISAPLFYEFGELTQEQQKRRRATKLVRCESALAPPEIQGFLSDWKKRAGTYTFKDLYVRNESIIFGYGDRIYKINSDTLGVAPGDFEEMAPDILRSMQEFGCNYGLYTGFLD